MGCCSPYNNVKQPSHSEQCSAYEDMGCCFTEVADSVSSVTQQGGQKIDLAAVTKALCSDYDIETEKCPEPSYGLTPSRTPTVTVRDAECQNEVGPLVQTLTAPECQQEFAKLGHQNYWTNQ